MIRVVENNDWVIATLLLLGALYILMFRWLQKDASFVSFLLQTYQESQNTFLCWVIISLGFVLSLSVLLSQYIPIIPKIMLEFDLEGFELNKMGVMLVVLLLYYFVKSLLTMLFYKSIGQWKKHLVLGFVAQRFYFVISVLIIILSIVHYYFPIDKAVAYGYYMLGIVVLCAGKILFYLFHKEAPLPDEWYYKILYICTLQILPLLAVWKFIFFL